MFLDSIVALEWPLYTISIVSGIVAFDGDLDLRIQSRQNSRLLSAEVLYPFLMPLER